jgi:hypothetical protein
MFENIYISWRTGEWGNLKKVGNNNNFTGDHL